MPHESALTVEERVQRRIDSVIQQKVAAACLHGQTFGFTWDDVDLLRQWRDADPYIVDAAWVDSLADRIAALLPPRT